MLKTIARYALIIAVFGFFVLNSPKEAEAEQDPRLFAHWAFDEGRGRIIKDSSFYENIGTANACIWKKGVKGMCLELNGKNSYINVHSNRQEVDEFTVELWLNNYGGGYIIDSPHIRLAGTHLVIPISAKGTKKATYLQCTISLNEWHHIVFVHKNKKYARLYLDGELRKEIKGVNKPSPVKTHRIGYYRTTTGSDGKYLYFHGFCGMLDEIKVYDEALSSEEIAGKYKRLMEKASAMSQ